MRVEGVVVVEGVEADPGGRDSADLEQWCGRCCQ